MIKRNSAKCTACGIEIESHSVHDFNVHYCKVEPEPGKKWEGDVLVPSGEETFRFAVDGGKEYLRRVGEGWIETSEVDDGKNTFCRECGASIPHRIGEGRCPACIQYLPAEER